MYFYSVYLTNIGGRWYTLGIYFKLALKFGGFKYCFCMRTKGQEISKANFKYSFEPKNEQKISALGFLKLGQKFFVCFLVQMKTFKSPFEIN